MSCPLVRVARGAGPLPLLAGFVALLLAALWAGLVRIGWEWPVPWEGMPAIHGALVVCGFLGGVIGIERAVALGRWWGWLTPVFAALGAAALLATLVGDGTLDPRWARALFVAEAAGLLAATVAILRRQPALHSAILVVGTAAWLAGNLLWLARFPIPVVVPWWMGWLLLTIAAERLELSRVTRPPPSAVRLFLLCVAVLAASLAWATVDPARGLRAVGVAFVAVAAWLYRFDVARRTIRMPGLPRFIASGLLAGYAWLAVAGAFLAAHAPDLATSALSRDFAYHAVFLGFVFSMIMAHAPVILPAVTGVPAAFSRALYVPLAALHASLALRLAADALALMPLRPWAALFNAGSILLFFAVLAGSTLRARLRRIPPAEGEKSRVPGPAEGEEPGPALA